MAMTIAGGSAVFFVGAGMSAMAGAPSWDQLIGPLRRRLNPASSEQNPLLVAQYFANQFSPSELYSYLREKLLRTRLQPTSAHEALCSMPVSVFVTTNYDDLLETQLQELGQRVHIIRDEENLAFWSEERETQVLKVHGDLSAPHSVVLADWDYVRFLCDRSLMKRKLAELFCYRTVIFVGYSLRDPNVSFIFNSIAYELGGLKRPAYFLTFETDEHQNREWRRRGMRPVCLRQAGAEPTAREKTRILTDFLHALQREVLSANRSIMIVDDDRDVVSALKNYLNREIEGATTYAATDGHAAMYALGRIRPRVLVVDKAMPKLDGIELIRMVRQFPELDSMKIIVLSGDPHAVNETTRVDLRIDYSLVKSDNSELEARCRELLGLRVREDSDLVLRAPDAAENVSPSTGRSNFPPALMADPAPGSVRKR